MRRTHLNLLADDLVVHCAASKAEWDIFDDEYYQNNAIARKNMLYHIP